MGKLLTLILLGCVVYRMATGRWPWQPKPRKNVSFAEAHARAVLGVSAEAGRAEILEAHRRRITLIHPDRGGSNEQVHEANAARDLLLKSLPVEPGA